VSSDDRKSRPEREQTNESLRTERSRTDGALLARQAEIDKDADLVVERARETADAVLAEAREKADRKLEKVAPHVATRADVEQQRVAEDEALRAERASADEGLRREREDDARALARLLPIERDKTDRFLLTERARSDEDLLTRDDFLGIVSHDLRNLLGGIVMSAGLISQQAQKGEQGKRTLEETARIQRYAARMNRLVGDLVDVASMDAGKLAVATAPGDCAALVDEAAEMFRSAASAKGISLHTQTAEGTLSAEFDHGRILQVLANLISNAIKFTPSGGSIHVRSERIGDDLRVCVSDTGSGIPVAMLEAVFERFWQVGKNDRRGVGLGLYISRCIVEAHGGRIWAESVEGEGSTFCFTLPGPTPSLV
jgi:signal transduction histidine kinase